MSIGWATPVFRTMALLEGDDDEIMRLSGGYFLLTLGTQLVVWVHANNAGMERG